MLRLFALCFSHSSQVYFGLLHYRVVQRLALTARILNSSSAILFQSTISTDYFQIMYLVLV